MSRRGAALACALCACAAATAQDLRVATDVKTVLTSMLGFSEDDLAELGRGHVVRHGLRSQAQSEVAVAGGVRVRATKAAFFARVRDIVEFKSGPGVVQIGKFGTPPTLDDLTALTIDRDDFDVRACRVGDCGIRLPASVIERFAREIDGKAPDAQARGAALFKQLLIDDVTAYLSGTDRMLQFDDGPVPIRPHDELEKVLAGMPEIGALIPELPEHLRHFPSSRVSDAEDFLYWSKEKFGVAPFISVTHVTIVCRGETCVMTTRDVYSSRYLDASVALAIATDAGPDSFDLVYDNRSRATALKGSLARLRHSLTEHRARGALEDNLKTIRKRLEKD